VDTAETITTKDAADATATLGTVTAESGVECGAAVSVLAQKRVLYEDAFGVTTTAYAAGDVIDAKMTATAVAMRNAGTGTITNVQLILAQTMPATVPAFVLHVFNEDPGTVGSDNAALAITETAAKTRAGPISLAGYSVLASGVQVFDSGPINRTYHCPASADDLFFVLEIKTATTFAADEMHLIVDYVLDR
jgi:hypothetical protein